MSEQVGTGRGGGVHPMPRPTPTEGASSDISPPSRAHRSTRTCSRCYVLKSADRFRLDSRGYQRSHCIDCSLLDSQDWRARHRDERLAVRRDRYAQLRAGRPAGARPGASA